MAQIFYSHFLNIMCNDGNYFGNWHYAFWHLHPIASISISSPRRYELIVPSTFLHKSIAS